MAKDFKKDQKEIERLRSKHSLYVEFMPDWAFFLDAYEGGRGFACAENVFKHVRENPEDYKDRLARLDNSNYCEGLVDFFTNFIFSEPIERTAGEGEDWYTTFKDNVNRKGDTVDSFMRKLCTHMQVFGTAYVLVDAPKTPNETLSVAQAKELGLRPYWVLMRPDEVLDWVRDEFDNLVYFKRVAMTQEMDPFTLKRRMYEVYTEITSDKYVVTKVDVTDRGKPFIESTEVIPNAIGRVPVETIYFKKSIKNPDIGISFLVDFAGNQRTILNLSSMLNDFLYRQAFNILAKEADGDIPLKEQEDGVIGTSNAMAVPKGAEFPKYISPPIDPAQFIQSERTRIVNEMFKRAAQDTMSEMVNGEKSSGFSQAQSFSKTVPHISTRADTLELAEVRLMELTSKFTGESWTGRVKYKDRYEITNLTDYLTQLLMIVGDLAMPSETFVKEELKKVVREFSSKLPPDILNDVYKDIDNMSFDKWREDIQHSGGQAAANQQKPKGTGTMDEIQSKAKLDNPTATNKLKAA